MKKLKLIVALAFIFVSTSNVLAQEKLKEKAAEQTKELNAKLGSETLTAEQETKVTALYVEKIKEIRNVKNEITDEAAQKEKTKEIHKSYSKRISEEILTEKQRAALKEFNKNKNKEK